MIRFAGVAFVDPWLEIFGGKFRERQAQVGQVALGVDQQRRYTGGERLLDQHDAKARLARARHADDDTVCREITAGQHHVLVGAFVFGGVD